jgi:phosphopantothenoylcysteine synthetase/decarboxylase
MLKGKKLVLGICGSIAAYKACELVRRLRERGAAVRVVLTPAAASFVSPLTLSVLSGGPVLSAMGDAGLWHMAHLEVADWADVVLVAPATADFLSRLAGGRSELLLDSLILSTKAKVALCPAMDAQMWEHPATQANVERVKTYGYQIWGPGHGALASGKKGMGRLLEQAEILDRLETLTASNGTRKAKSRV